MIENRSGRSAWDLPAYDLTPREAQVFAMYAYGMNNKGIAEMFNISPATIKVHSAHGLSKLDTSSRAYVVIELFKAQRFNIDDYVNDDDLGRINLLSPRELNVFASMYTNKDKYKNTRAVGEELVIELETVRFHKTRMYKKLGISTKTRAIVLGYAAELRGMSF